MSRPHLIPVVNASIILTIAIAAETLRSSDALARSYDLTRLWYAEGSVGTIQPGPDGTDFGVGQNYAIHAGFQMTRWADLGISLARANARESPDAIETSVTSGGLRARGWVGEGRWLPYAEVGARLYRFEIEQTSVIAQTSNQSTRAGGHAGVGVLYARTTWWAGIGAELHGCVGSAGLEGGDLLTFTTYNVFVGGPFGW